MPSRTSFAPGKIILTGEYAVVFGYPGIAVPSPLTVTVKLDNRDDTKDLRIHWDEIADLPEWQEYLKTIISRCGKFSGDLTIENNIPLGKGMGSSTALVIAVTRCLLGDDCKEKALEIENELSPGNSGLDFAVIWNSVPTLFKKDDDPQPIDLPKDILQNAILIDTGAPNETTPELIAWIEERKEELKNALKNIGHCTEQLAGGKELYKVMRDHHFAQIQLGVVPGEVRDLVDKIERVGGSAKIIGAGGRTGGGGMVLAIQHDREKLQTAIPSSFPTFIL
jgi:mevalonate kinase